jgi:hypothetical protein
MKIAIYGDSWASEFLNEPHDYSGWPEILANQSGYEVTNFAVPGSSLYFSYKEFSENHKKYDVNIFLITDYGRLYVKSIPEYSRNKTSKHIPNLLNVINRKKQLPNDPLDPVIKNRVMKIYDTLENYYTYIQDDDRDELIDQALVHHAKSISTNTIFIPCFRGYEEFSLINVFEMENDSMGANEKYFSKNIHVNTEIDGKLLIDVRVCHMTKRNNELLAEKLIKSIEENNMSVKFSLDDFVAPIDGLEEAFVWRDI